MIVDGANDQAVLVGVQDDNEYQISLSALYGDGAQSEAVAIRYSTSELSVHAYISHHNQFVTISPISIKKVLYYFLT